MATFNSRRLPGQNARHAPARVKSLMTTRSGGSSQTPWTSLNLGDHVGDDPARVAANRARLRQQLPAFPANRDILRACLPGERDRSVTVAILNAIAS